MKTLMLLVVALSVTAGALFVGSSVKAELSGFNAKVDAQLAGHR